MTDPPALERLLRQDRTITLTGLTLLCAVAWLYIGSGAGLGMSAWQMTSLALFPHRHRADAMSGMQTFATLPWDASAFGLTILMWWIMMIAMMTPSAAPTMLLYARVYRQAPGQPRPQAALAPIGVFVLGYLLAWLTFSVAAAALQALLQHVRLVSAMMMGTQSRWLSAAALLSAGLYQLSGPKDICLTHCRSPTSFLLRHWRPGSLGALRLGALHGAYCVGCCGLLMTLLFVGGVMNLVWIAALALLVLIEKAFSTGRWVGRCSAAVLITWGMLTLLV